MQTTTQAKKRKSIPPTSGARMVGEEVKLLPIETVKPNGWNPNRMTKFMRESLKSGLLVDGWLLSQSLLIWGSDEKGRKRNLIIDGEHRWTVAQEIGFVQAPMVFLHRITEARAKGLTIKMNQKRGEFDEAELAVLVRQIQEESGADLPFLANDLGIEDAELTRLLNDGGHTEDGDGSPPGDVGSGMETHVKMTQLFFNKEQHEEFISLVKATAPGFGTKNVSDTTLEALRRAAAHAKHS